MSGNRTLRTCLRGVSLDHVRQDRDGLVDAHFTPEERLELEPRGDRSVAGRLALKMALRDLALEAGLPGAPETSQIVLGRGPEGEPRVLEFPDVPGILRVSVTHDSISAWGVAALQEGT